MKKRRINERWILRCVPRTGITTLKSLSRIGALGILYFIMTKNQCQERNPQEDKKAVSYLPCLAVALAEADLTVFSLIKCRTILHDVTLLLILLLFLLIFYIYFLILNFFFHRFSLPYFQNIPYL